VDELREFDRLVSLIYEMPLMPGRLPTVVEHLTKWFDGDGGHLVGWDCRSGETLVSVSVGTGEAAGWRVGSRGEDLPSGGIRSTLGSTLLSDRGRQVQIAFQRHAGHGGFSEHEVRWLGRLTPHLKGAVSLLLQVNALRQKAEGMSAGLDLSPLALIAVNAGRKPVFSNRQAEALVRDGAVLCLRDGLLHATVPKQDATLCEALQTTATSGSPRNLVLSADSQGPRPVRLSLTSIRTPATCEESAGSGAVVLCVIAAIGARRLATVGQLMELFGLSPAEARLLRALAQGETLDAYARECDLRMSTVKTQLHSLFVKTGTHRQTELVRLVMDVPVVRG
jgi:DNA-binding CsgD family transcriptional regulator